MKQTIKLRDRVRRISIISTLYAIGLVEAYYLPRYGIQWLLAGLMATVLLASFWIRSRWNLLTSFERLRPVRKGCLCELRQRNGRTRLAQSPASELLLLLVTSARAADIARIQAFNSSEEPRARMYSGHRVSCNFFVR